MYGTVECLVYVRIQCRFVTKEACFILIFFFSALILILLLSIIGKGTDRETDKQTDAIIAR